MIDALPQWLAREVSAARMTIAWLDEECDPGRHVAAPLLTDPWPPRQPPAPNTN